MSSKRNQTIAIARFLMYKYGLNQQLEGMTDEEYLAHPMYLWSQRSGCVCRKPVDRQIHSLGTT